MSNSHADVVYKEINLRVWFDADPDGIAYFDVIAPCDEDWSEGSANLLDVLTRQAQEEISAMIMRREVRA